MPGGFEKGSGRCAPAGWERVESSGAGPFESRRVWRLPDGSEYVWEDRRHRKGRGPSAPSGRAAEYAPELRGRSRWLEFYAPRKLSWWIAVIFIVGSALFTLGATASLFSGVFGGRRARRRFPASPISRARCCSRGASTCRFWRRSTPETP